MEIKPSEDLAYWVGTVQSDGCLKKQRNRYYIQFSIAPKSLPMLKKVQEVSKNLFNRNAKIFYSKKYNQFYYKTGIKELLKQFQKIDINFEKPIRAPLWCLTDIKLFGAYLGGVIDADGDVRISRPEYPQCIIRIWTNGESLKLKNQIEKMLNCSVNTNSRYRACILDGRIIVGTGHRLEFYVSKKNFKIVKDNLLIYLQLKYKERKIRKFIDENWPQWCSG